MIFDHILATLLFGVGSAVADGAGNYYFLVENTDGAVKVNVAGERYAITDIGRDAIPKGLLNLDGTEPRKKRRSPRRCPAA